MIDVVIPVKKQGRHVDLKYSLRSLDRFFVHDRVFIAGYAPNWLDNIVEISRNQSRHLYRANAFLNIQKAVNHKDISEQIVISNDDIFFVRPVAEIPFEHGLRIQQQAWARTWPYTQELLKKYGVAGRHSWEHHIPALVEKDKIRFILGLIRREYPTHFDKVQWRSVYYNYFGVKGIVTNDVKTLGVPVILEGQQFFSTEDHTFKQSLPFLKEMFPEKSIYEK